MGDVTALPRVGVTGGGADPFATGGFQVDLDRAQTVRCAEVVRRRFDGRFAIDAFGADPQLQDLLAPIVHGVVRVSVTGAEHIPTDGPGLFVSNRGLGVLEPAALSVAVRNESCRRLRVIGATDLPILGDLARKFGSFAAYPGDLAALLRAGHLAALPLASTWLRSGGGVPPTELLVAVLGYPVIPVAIRPGGPFGLPIMPWRVTFGTPIVVGELRERDPLSAAELAEAVRAAVQNLA